MSELASENLYLPLKEWGMAHFQTLPDRKTLLKAVPDLGYDAQKIGGNWYVRRKASNVDLPKNLYQEGGRYRYRNPTTGERTWFPTGTSRDSAIQAAIELNNKLLGQNDIVAQILGSPNFSVFADEHMKRVDADEKLKASTKKNIMFVINRFKRNFNKPIGQISLNETAEFLNGIPPKIRPQYRGRLIKIWAIAVAQGAVSENIPEKTEKNTPPKKSRPPISLEEFHRFYNHPLAEEWFQIAMDLALYTMQREGDVLNMRHDQEEDGRIPVIQEKTGAAIMMKIGPKVRAILNRSMRSTVLSQFLVHRPATSRYRHTQVRADYLRKVWQRIAKDLYGDDPYPTFHEIRGLSVTVYRNHKMNAQKLAGHKDKSMTDKYDQQVRFEEAGTL